MIFTTSKRRTLPQKARPRSRGFTLLEIMLVVALIAIVFVGVVPVVSASMSERRLREAAEEIADVVREQRMGAQETGVRRELGIRKEGLVIPDGEGGEQAIFTTPDGVDFLVRYPGGKWAEADGQWWEISPTGMVTPLSVRFEENDNWIELDFDVLTGRVAEERYAF
jgi:prepilin-type N-terminal cleavage/methylation domain